MKSKKLSKSKASINHCEIKSKPISKKMEEKLKKASCAASKNINRNNMIYQSSNSHSHEYPVGCNKVKKLGGR